MASKAKVPAIAYLRTSSATNVGADKDSDRRQREAITAFASRARYELVGEFYDSAVSGADPIDARPGFAAMLERIEGNGVRTILVETASRFARDLMVQEVGHASAGSISLRRTTPAPSSTTRPRPGWCARCSAPSPNSTRL
jgi:DNA invertase Pin-like site-specific DNA recombinase